MTVSSPVPEVVLLALRAGPEVESQLAHQLGIARRNRLLVRMLAWAVLGAALMGTLLLTSSPLDDEFPAWLIPGLLVALVLLVFGLFAFLERQARRAFAEACDADDEARILVSGGIWAATTDAAMQPIALLTRAIAFGSVGKDREALAALDEIDMRAASPSLVSQQPLLRAWYLARTGEAERALELLDELEGTGMVTATQIDGTRGAALVHAGRPEESLAPLQRAIASAEDRDQARNLYHLAEAHRCLGRADDARRTYERATTAPGGTRWQQRARAALAVETYRDARPTST